MAGITYKIKGQHDNKAIDQAKAGLQSLGQVANSVNTVFKGFLALKAVSIVKDVVSDSLSAYATQQKAISSLTVAIDNNAKLTSKSLKNIIDYTQQLQSKSIFGDEALQGQATLLAAMGLTEIQIKKVLNAAVELSSAGVGTLEGNVKNLAKTFGGMTGELGESIPALKNLTKEQLVHGDAVDLIAKKYKGFAENLALNTFEGQVKQLNNVLGDFKESLGAAFAPLASPFVTFVTNLISKWTEAIGQVTKYNALVAKGTKRTAQDEYDKKSIELARAKQDRDTDIKTTLGDFGTWLKQQMISGSSRYQYNSSDPKRQAVQYAQWQSDYNQLYQAFISTPRQQEFQKKIEVLTEETGKLAEIIKRQDDVEEEQAKTIAETLAVTNGEFVDDFTQAMQAYTSNGVNYGSGTSQDNYYSQYSGSNYNGQNSYDAEYSTDNAGSSGLTKLFNSLSSTLGPIIGQFGNMLSSISSVNAILNPVQTILAGFFEIAGPILDELLTPLVGILMILGRTIAMLLVPATKALAPIIDAVSAVFIWLYNKVIVPVGNGFIWLYTTIYNGFVKIINGILSAIDRIPFVNVSYRMSELDASSMYLDKITNEDLYSAGATGSSSTSSASYTGAKEIYINIYYDHSYVNGDAREIANNLWREINELQNLGLLSV